MSANDRTVVVGAGLVGSLLPMFLRRRGLTVEVYEKGPDIREAAAGGRSINLVITNRGLYALARLGLEQQARELTVPVMGRMIHGTEGEIAYQPYGRDESECNYSISRKQLNEFLVSRAEESGVGFHFGHELARADLDRGKLTFNDATADAPHEVDASLVFGADGAVSAVRTELMRQPGADESAVLMEHGYKELLIPVAEGATIEKHALHIWPRGDIMLMALPNQDGSFTVTLYLRYEGPQSFASLNDPAAVTAFFKEHFPDAVPLIPDLTDAFFANPTGNLGTVKCRPWYRGGRALLIGDAAHAIVPFFGQGMNCGFEDCAVLDDLLDRRGVDDWEWVFSEFDRERKPNADAIADMALENFVEMSERVGDRSFLLRKQVEHRLEQEMPREYRSRYSMVMYSRIPYRAAFDAGLIQREILEELCDGLESAEDLDLGQARRLIAARLEPFLRERGVTLDY